MKVTIETSLGPIVAELDEASAPDTTRNFLAYADAGFYDETVFHRVISGFMIQGGGFEPGMHQKDTLFDPIENEANNKLSNETGTLAMARTPDPHSATAQFFINTSDNDFLNFREPTQDGWGYCVFGRVVEGMNVVSEIEGVATGTRGPHRDVPLEDVVIQRISRSD